MYNQTGPTYNVLVPRPGLLQMLHYKWRLQGVLHLIYLHQILLQSWHRPQSQVDMPHVQATQICAYMYMVLN